MGGTNIFELHKGSFAGIADQFRVDKFFHKSFIDFDDESCELAREENDTTGLKSKFATSPPPQMFACDRPFVFVVHDSVFDNILFMGKYVKP